MQRELEIELIRRALDHIERKASDADGEPFELSVERYLSSDVHAREVRMLRRRPVVVGFGSEVARPGDVLAHDHAGVPVIVTRAPDGELHAFFNACRHRGTKIVTASTCGASQLVCPYHGWSYDLRGRLRGIPHRNEVAGFDLERRNLVELPVWERFGLVFVQMTPGERADIETAMGPLCGDLESFGFGRHVLFAPSVRTRKVNWKLVLDGSWETYHFRTTHEKTIAPLFFDNTGVFDWVEPGLRMVLPKRTISELRALPESEWTIRPHANLIYSLFPNSIVLVQPDHAMVLTLWAEAPDRTTVVAGMLIPEPPTTEKAIAYWKKNERIFWDAIEEDVQMGERIQATLASGANSTLLCGRAEHLIGKYQRVIERAVAEV